MSTAAADSTTTAAAGGTDRGPSRRGAKAAAIVLGVIFVGLAAIQVFSVVSGTSTRRVTDDVLAPIADPTTTRWLLREGDAPDGKPLASAFFDARRSRILVGGRGLPELRADEVYVLWALDRSDAGRSPRNLAAFRGGGAVVDVVVADAPGPSDLMALSVSVESNPAAKSPTVGRVVATGHGP